MEENVWGSPTIESSPFDQPISSIFGTNLNTTDHHTTNTDTDTLNTDKLSLIKSSLSKLPSLNDNDNTNSNSSLTAWIELVNLITDQGRPEEFTSFKQYAAQIDNLNDKSKTGFALIHYIIAFDRAAYIELLYNNGGINTGATKLDLNITDDVIGYTPLMWAFTLGRQQCCTELFNFADEIDFNRVASSSGLKAWDMVVPYSQMYYFLEQHGFLRYQLDQPKGVLQQGQGQQEYSQGISDTKLHVDPVLDSIDLKLAGMGLGASQAPLIFGEDNGNNINNNNNNININKNNDYGNDFDGYHPNFNFNKLEKYQFVEFSDYDIPYILDYLVTLPNEKPHMTTYPAALLFQCARYAEHKLNKPQLLETLLLLGCDKAVSSSLSSSTRATLVNTQAFSGKTEMALNISSTVPLTATDGTVTASGIMTTASAANEYNNNNNRGGTSGSADGKSNSKSKSKSKSTKEKSRSKRKSMMLESVSGGDIVKQSYWIGALTFLYYYLSKDESFFKRYPNVLQKIVDSIHALIIELTSSIHSRLRPLVDSTLLNYTTIKDVEQTLYKKDWNFFKRRKQAKELKEENKRKLERQEEQQRRRTSLERSISNQTRGQGNANSNDAAVANDIASVASSKISEPDSPSAGFFDTEIIKHLYPPTLEEQMKPSPMKIVQIFGALNYVLNLHQIHPLFQQQCLSTAVDWFSTHLFNTILKDRSKKLLCRARAIQIRLNLSSLETWIKNNDLAVQRPKLIDNFMWERFPYTLVQELSEIDLDGPLPLKNVATYKPIENYDESSTVVHDTSNSLFYYQHFHRIAQIYLEPLMELLQWLQIATTLDSEEALDNTRKLLPQLTNFQLLKAINKYHYEINEHKFNSKLKKKLNNEIKQSKLPEKAYLDENRVPLLALPTIAELTDAYARDYEFLPFLPDDIQDVLYDIHDRNRKLRMNDETFIAGQEIDDKDEDTEGELNDDGGNDDNDNGNSKSKNEGAERYSHDAGYDGGNYMFSELSTPSAAVSRPAWAVADSGIEDNPW